MPDWRDLPEAVAGHRLLTMGPPLAFRPLADTDGRHLLTVARAAGMESIGLSVHRENARVLGLYRSLGLVVCRELVSPVDGLPQYKMERQL